MASGSNKNTISLSTNPPNNLLKSTNNSLTTSSIIKPLPVSKYIGFSLIILIVLLISVAYFIISKIYNKTGDNDEVENVEEIEDGDIEEIGENNTAE